MKRSDKKGPRKDDLVYGARAVIEAMQAGVSLDKVLIRKDVGNELRSEVMALARDHSVQVQYVPVETINRLAPGANHQGVIAFLSLVMNHDLEEIILRTQEKGEMPFFVMLDQVTDVRNIGAIARSCECMGVHGLILPTQNSGRINSDAIKVSAGALHHLPVSRVANLVDALNLLKAYGIRTIACTEKAADNLYGVKMNEPVCLILGSEESGISPKLLKNADDLAQIPLSGNVQSLNVSVAAGIFISEVVRQRSV